MSDHVYKSVEITGSSPDGVQQAIDNALAKAGKTLRNIDWFEVRTSAARSRRTCATTRSRSRSGSVWNSRDPHYCPVGD